MAMNAVTELLTATFLFAVIARISMVLAIIGFSGRVLPIASETEPSYAVDPDGRVCFALLTASRTRTGVMGTVKNLIPVAS